MTWLLHSKNIYIFNQEKIIDSDFLLPTPPCTKHMVAIKSTEKQSEHSHRADYNRKARW